MGMLQWHANPLRFVRASAARVAAYAANAGKMVYNADTGPLQLQDGQRPGGGGATPIARARVSADAAQPLASPALLRGAVVLNASMTTAAKNAAIAAGIASGQKAIEFRPETHVETKTPTPGALGEAAALLIANSVDLTVIGNGARILFDGADKSAYADTLTLLGNRHLTLRDFTIDYRYLPFVQATLVSKTANSVTFVQDAEYDDSNVIAFAWRTCQRIEGFDPASGVYTGTVIEWNRISGGFTSGGVPHDRAITINPNSTFTVDMSDTSDHPQIAGMTVGGSYLIQHAVYGGDGIRGFGNAGVTFDNVVAYAAAGMGVQFYGWDGGVEAQRDVTLRNGAGVTRKPGTRRVQSVNADGLHFQGVRGRLSLNGAVSEWCRDDCLNTYDFDTKIVAVLNATTFVIGGFRPWVKGDILNAIDPDGRLRGTMRVTTVTFDAPNNRWIYTVDAQPSGFAVNWIIQCKTGSAEVEIRNSSFGNSRGRAILGGADRWLIQGCRFCSLPTSTAITIHQDFPNNNEGPMPSRVEILDSTFFDVNIADALPGALGGYDAAVIEIASFAADGETPSPAGQIGSVTIKNNGFGRTRNSDILVIGAGVVDIDNNTHLSWGNGADGAQPLGYAANAIGLHNVSDARVGAGQSYIGSGKRVGSNAPTGTGVKVTITPRPFIEFPYIGGSGATFQAAERATEAAIGGPTDQTFATFAVELPPNPQHQDLYAFRAPFGVTNLVVKAPGAGVDMSPGAYTAKLAIRYVYSAQYNAWYLDLTGILDRAE